MAVIGSFNGIHYNLSPKRNFYLLRFLYSIVNLRKMLKRRLHQGPLVSVIVPFYNERTFVIETLESLRKQDYQNFECIILNDCSTDLEAVQLVSDYVAKDSRFKLHSHEVNKGLSAARNTAIKYATGKYVCYLDADDVLTRSSISRRVYHLQRENPFVAGSYSMIFASEEKIPRGLTCLLNYLYFKTPTIDYLVAEYDCPFVVHSPLVKTEVMKQFAFDEALKFGSEDWDCWARILRSGYRFVGTESFGGIYRQRKNSMIRRNSNEISHAAEGIIRSYSELDAKVKGPYPFHEPQHVYQVKKMVYSRTIMYFTFNFLKNDQAGCDDCLSRLSDKTFVREFINSENVIKRAISRFHSLPPQKIPDFEVTSRKIKTLLEGN